MKYLIYNLRPGDWNQIRSIYMQGIATGHSTFEMGVPDWEKWDADHLADPRLAARADDTILGWAVLSAVSNRCVYSGVAEISLYVGAGCRDQGIGSALLAALIEAAEKEGIWTLQGVIFPQNTGSLALVKKHGFREVGYREKLGKMTYGPFAGTWCDVILVERRSKIAGTE